jgi:hypothetical protein
VIANDAMTSFSGGGGQGLLPPAAVNGIGRDARRRCYGEFVEVVKALGDNELGGLARGCGSENS